MKLSKESFYFSRNSRHSQVNIDGFNKQVENMLSFVNSNIKREDLVNITESFENDFWQGTVWYWKHELS